jgi:hypothetical protein
VKYRVGQTFGLVLADLAFDQKRQNRRIPNDSTGFFTLNCSACRLLRAWRPHLGSTSVGLPARRTLVRLALKNAASLFALVALLSSAQVAQASPITLAPGQGTTTITSAQNQGLTSPGTLLATMTQAFNIGSGHVVGNVISAVYRNSLGYLDFYYQVTNTTATGLPNTSVSGVAGSNFGTATTAVGYYSTASPFGGVFLNPSASGPAGGAPLSGNRVNPNVVGLFFGPPFGNNRIDPGDESTIVMIATNARAWSYGWATVQNGGPASISTVRAFQVPEAATATLVLFGLAALAGVHRRRSQ